MPPTDGQSEGLAEGEVFAGYTIVRRLGAGGMGEVYLAQHPRLPRRDALKILTRELTANEDFRKRFNREADLVASLYNEHIVGIHDRGEYEGQLWLSMDYVEGTDAGDLLYTRYPSGMPPADVIEIITAVADALDYAHARGLLHRDVKPANILLGEGTLRRRILLADFGIARELGDISRLTATNMLMGTTAYCSPEQLQGADLDGRADQYALACTAFHMLAGSAPFQHSNPAVIITKHLTAPPPPISERRPDLADLNPVLAKALSKNPAERYANCTEFAAALAGQLGVGTPEATAPTGYVSMPTEAISTTGTKPLSKLRSRVRPATVAAAVVAAVLVTVAVILGVRVFRSDRPASSPAPAQSVAPEQDGAAPATPALELTTLVTDQAKVLTPPEHAAVERALDKLYDERGTRLWVVYVKDFGGLKPARWAEETVRANGFVDTDAILAVATDRPAFAFRVPAAITVDKPIDVEVIRRDRIEPAISRHEWTRAALAAANGLDVPVR
ncbi:protein kinase [Mycobacterium kubicae]|uniref:serine/threonine-protein kinase n=1 Tax=Mycobacterium kubicae TaxID=120959 RepID=UPI0016415324|nr:serine/threonine-protein kinase [Mycobacterium kubicae]QNI06844.1 protein kinase [Mycobacterium kubicae]